YKLVEQRKPTTLSFKDGFYLRYLRNELEVVVQYYDMEFRPIFHRDMIDTEYMFIDENIFSNASGFSGDMFPLEKLEPVIRKIARDIRANYQPILKGEDSIWNTI